MYIQKRGEGGKERWKQSRKEGREGEAIERREGGRGQREKWNRAKKGGRGERVREGQQAIY